jgi:hypothetical protein
MHAGQDDSAGLLPTPHTTCIAGAARSVGCREVGGFVLVRHDLIIEAVAAAR